MDLSVVLPVYNEKRNLLPVYQEIRAVLERYEGASDGIDEWEMIFVDDGSSDGSYDHLRRLHEGDDRVTVVKLATNFGQSSALDAGLRYASGDVVVTMDADGQNDPEDIPRLLSTLREENLDCVVGWRRDREDPVSKTLASKTACTLRRLFLGIDIHDYGCTLKAFRREAAKAVQLNGEMHRYIPPLLTWKGFDVDEIEVNHRERANGETKYSWQRLPKGFLDMLNVWFWKQYAGRPLHVFGGIGLIVGTVGFLAGMYSVYLKAVYAVSLSDSALPLFAVFMCLLGIQFFISGILADIGLRNYFALRRADEYRVSAVLRGDPLEEVEQGRPIGSFASNLYQDGENAHSDA